MTESICSHLDSRPASPGDATTPVAPAVAPATPASVMVASLPPSLQAPLARLVSPLVPPSLVSPDLSCRLGGSQLGLPGVAPVYTDIPCYVLCSFIRQRPLLADSSLRV